MDSTRKISIVKDSAGNPLIDIECSFNKDIKRSIQQLSKVAETSQLISSGRHCQLTLTENNLVAVISELKKFNFERSEHVESLYKDILAINKKEVIESFNISNIDNPHLKLLLSKEIDDTSDVMMLTDRRIKYQFTVNEIATSNETLTAKLAARSSPKVFVNSDSYTLKSLSISLRELNRTKSLGIFDEYDVKSCIENLKLVHDTFESLGMRPNIGVYFRFPNEGDGKIFNELVAEYGYNSQLDLNCRVAIIANGKLPKFFLKNVWYPDTTVSFCNQFRNNKTSIYCNSCDMIVYYNTVAPLVGVVDAIV